MKYLDWLIDRFWHSSAIDKGVHIHKLIQLNMFLVQLCMVIDTLPQMRSIVIKLKITRLSLTSISACVFECCAWEQVKISRTKGPFLFLLRTQAILEAGYSISILHTVSHCSACRSNSFLELMDPKKLACTVSPYLCCQWPHPFHSDSLRHDQWLNPVTDERLLPLVWVREWMR